MAVLVLFFKMRYCIGKRVLIFHSSKYILTGERLPRSYDYRCALVMLADKRNRFLDFSVLSAVSVGEDYCRCVFYLVVKELTEVLHIHFALICIGNGGEAVKNRTLALNGSYSLYNVRKLSNARRLDNYSVGRKFVDNLCKCLGKISDERAAYAARVHFCYFYSCILKKSAVNSYLTELVLYKNHLFVAQGFLYKLFYESSFSRSQKSRNYINFRHFLFSPESRATSAEICILYILYYKFGAMSSFIRNFQNPLLSKPHKAPQQQHLRD